MKWNKFKDKLPALGTNILVMHESKDMIGFAEFNLETRKAIKNSENSCEYFAQHYFNDDISEDKEWDIRDSDFWIYPSQIMENS